ncbi:hypothetical protein D0867_03407 [Hortaea werneckii]|uniref:Amino acid permease/ SLC12A domain-containing protein n=1 Tax=Hortaea werneckii TaxID=91943 RepID=A0A3M7A165_HORWE|nr:hypothetical protein D0867_03407 [Hortaea werneckii]RMY40495.1 hypothetical protein D0866_01228 [Hortaea werneckii]
MQQEPALELKEQAGSIELASGKGIFPTVRSEEHTSDEHLDQQDAVLRTTMTTAQDASDMQRMGKTQELIRRFRQISMISFVTIATAAWEIGLFIISPGLINGGRSGLIYSSIWNFIGFGPIYLSMSEMASMAPIAGAQYHWVSEFAPEKYQRLLSYVTGWTSTMAWQAGNAMGIFLAGSLVQTIILINNANYAFPSWRGTLLAFASMLVAFVGSVYGAKVLPYWQTTVFALHVLGFLAYIVPIWINASKASHRQVWAEFQNEGGWSSMGLSLMVGQLVGISQQVGIDTAAHMSEGVRDAASSVPKTMISVYFINFALMFLGIVTICYHIPDLDAALNDSTTYPATYVLKQSLGNGPITVIMVLIAFVTIASNIVYLTAVTRDLYAFARDNGLPYSNWLSRVDSRRRIPVNATIFSSIVACLLALIYIGSPVAFYAITSLATVSLLQCYTLSIACMLWRRIYEPDTLPKASFSLGSWGILINATAVVYGLWAFFWAFWPQATPIDAAGFNWASPIFAAVLLMAMSYFVLKARNEYFGPVTSVEGRDVGAY